MSSNTSTTAPSAADLRTAIEAMEAEVAAKVAALQEAEVAEHNDATKAFGTAFAKTVKPLADAIGTGDEEAVRAALGITAEALTALRTHVTPEPVQTAVRHRAGGGGADSVNGRDDVMWVLATGNRGEEFTHTSMGNATSETRNARGFDKRSGGFCANILRNFAEEGVAVTAGRAPMAYAADNGWYDGPHAQAIRAAKAAGKRWFAEGDTSPAPSTEDEGTETA